MSRLVSESWLTAVGRAWLFEFLQQGFQVRGVKKKSKGRVQIKGAGRRAELEWEVCNSLDLLSLPVWGACFLPTSPKRKALCWKFHMWASRWFCKPSHRHLKVLVSFVSKVFFPAVRFFVRGPVLLLVLFCLGCCKRQGKYSPAEEGRVRGQRRPEEVGFGKDWEAQRNKRERIHNDQNKEEKENWFILER